MNLITTLQIGLEARSFDVDAYNDPELVLSNFRPGLYDLVLVDIMMPKMVALSYMNCKESRSQCQGVFSDCQ
jgi:DNA-binding response OmpR family regulator